MIGSNKILTVSYGTFSCTLEGFDDSFSTMKAIAEYFRDLAADDRYFGAEPPTPDVEMLAKIAEKEIMRRVEARTDGNEIVLRPSAESENEAQAARQDEQSKQAAPEREVQAHVEPTADELRSEKDGGSVSAKLARIKAVVDQERLYSQPEKNDSYVNTEWDQEGGDIENVTSGSEGYAEAFSGELMAAWHEDDPSETTDEETVAEAAEDGSQEESNDTDTTLEHDADHEDEGVEVHHNGHDHHDAAHHEDASAADEDQESHSADEETVVEAAEDRPQEESNDTDTTLEHDANHEDEDEGVEVHHNGHDHHDAAHHEDAPAADATLGGDENHEVHNNEEVPTDHEGTSANESVESVPEQKREPRVIRLRSLAPPVEVASQHKTDVDVQVDSSTESEGYDEVQTQRVDEVTQPEAHLEHDGQGSKDVPKNEALDAVQEQMTIDEGGAAESVQGDESHEAESGEHHYNIEEFDEEYSVASLDGVDELSEHIEDFKETDEIQALSADDEAELQEELADVERDIAQTPIPKRTLPEADAATLQRIEKQTNEELDESEGSERRSAFSHLKAAVTATKAALHLGETGENEVERAERPFRHDLEQIEQGVSAEKTITEGLNTQERELVEEPVASPEARVIRPVRPVRPASASVRPQAVPFQLDSSQRIDTQRPGSSDVGVLPRRIVVAHSQAPASGFAQFAEGSGAKELPDLLEAAAAYVSFVEGSENFSRPQIMKEVQNMSETEFSREEGLRHFGALLREGRIHKTQNGRFQVSEQTRFRPSQKAG